MICAFFGNHDVFLSQKEDEKLESAAEKLILEEGVTCFWFCQQGYFDLSARGAVLRLKRKYPHITAEEVCAYMPKEKPSSELYEYLFPEEVALSHPRTAIIKRNDYMIKHADFFICFVRWTFGGAYTAMKKAEKKGKRLINLCDLD